MPENQRNLKAEKIILGKAQEFIQRECNNQSLITVTSISTSKDFHNVDLFVTVFPEQKENAALDFLKRQRGNFREYIKKETRLMRIPTFDFLIDLGEKHRQRIDEII